MYNQGNVTDDDDDVTVHDSIETNVGLLDLNK